MLADITGRLPIAVLHVDTDYWDMQTKTITLLRNRASITALPQLSKASKSRTNVKFFLSCHTLSRNAIMTCLIYVSDKLPFKIILQKSISTNVTDPNMSSLKKGQNINARICNSKRKSKIN